MAELTLICDKTQRRLPDGESPLDDQPKKRIKTEDADLLIQLPSAKQYERSYMHREPVSHVLVSTKYDFIFTASTDGHLKFWRKAV